MNPFVNVHVQPSYGRNQAIITWNVIAGYATGDFYVYKSSNSGLPPWELLNDTPATGGMYVDTNHTGDEFTYYRVLLIKDSVEYDSDIVKAADKLSRAQYGGISKIMRMEYLRMSTGNGIQVLHYIPLTSGALAPNVDPLTKQRTGIECPDVDTSYGLPYIGGYGPPIYTWLEISTYGESVVKEGDNKLDVDDDITHKARMLAFPTPAPGHLIVHPATDNRYGIKSPVQGHYFRGAFPISYDVSMTLLRLSDPRYRVPVPSPLPVPLWAQV